jgi:hypothetical protein
MRIMKKNLLLLMIAGVFISSISFSQVTIAGWTFDDAEDTEFVPNLGLETNTWNLRAETDSGDERPVSLTEGNTTYAATATNWDNGENDKYWSIRFRAEGFDNLKFSSVQFSDSEGPKNWKIQTRISGADWTDLPEGTYIVEDNWTAGVLTDIVLPEEFQNPGSINLFIRWMMADNEAVNGSDVTETSISKINNIIITGEDASGFETELFNSKFMIYPNPCNDYFIVESSKNVENMSVYNIQGQKVMNISQNFTGQYIVPTSNLSNGVYFVEIQIENEINLLRKKIIVN